MGWSVADRTDTRSPCGCVARCTLHAVELRSLQAMLIDGVAVASDPTGVIVEADELGIEIEEPLLSTVFDAWEKKEQGADAGCETSGCSQRAVVVCGALRHLVRCLRVSQTQHLNSVIKISVARTYQSTVCVLMA